MVSHIVYADTITLGLGFAADASGTGTALDTYPYAQKDPWTCGRCSGEMQRLGAAASPEIARRRGFWAWDWLAASEDERWCLAGLAWTVFLTAFVIARTTTVRTTCLAH